MFCPKKKMWKREFIPDEDDLYRRVPKDQYDEKMGKVSSGAFMLREDKNEKALSVNWSKWTTPEESSVCPITGNRYYLGALYAEVPRHQGLEVIHAPSRKNRAHSLITGQRLIDSNFLIADILAENCRPLIANIEQSNFLEQC